MTDTINPPTTMLITMIAAGPAIPTTAIERTLQLCLVEFSDPARQHRQLPGFIAQPQHPHRHGRECLCIG